MRINLKTTALCLAVLGTASAPNRVNAQVKAKHVLLISIDGFHAIDLQNCIAAETCPNLADLEDKGILYSNASTSRPSDSFPGLIAQVTGGSPISTGVWYDAGYDRTYFPPGTFDCTGLPGAPATFDETIDHDLTQIDGGVPGSLASLNGAIAITPANLPVGPDCKPVYPHSFLRVNTIFEVAKAAGLRTAWSDKHPAYDIVNGPSGAGVEDLYTPEINSNISSYKPTPNCTGTIWTDSLCAVEFYDHLKVKAILNEIGGFDHTGKSPLGVPNVFGMNFQTVSVGQKLATDPYGETGYADPAVAGASGVPNPGLLNAIEFVDASIGRMVSELKGHGIYDETLIIVSAKHGQSPIDINKINNTGFPGASLPGCAAPPPIGKGCRLDDSLYTTLVPPLGAGGLLTDDDVALLWLPATSQSNTESYVAALSEPAHEWTLGIKQIYSGASLELRYNNPLQDNRTPDILVEPNYGVIYTGGSKIAEHGGIAEDDTHVALLVSKPSIVEAEIKSPVTTMQIAPTILRALGLNPNALQAVQIEHTKVLPGLF
jgi:hypothetical protein